MQLHVVPNEHRQDPRALLSWLADERVTVCFVPTVLAQQMITFDLPSELGLRELFVGGSRLHPFFRKLPFRVSNMYGTAETTVIATSCSVDPGETVKIGRPISGARVAILDGAGEYVAIGAIGELWVGGDVLANGYTNRPDLTRNASPSIRRWTDLPYRGLGALAPRWADHVSGPSR